MKAAITLGRELDPETANKVVKRGEFQCRVSNKGYVDTIVSTAKHIENMKGKSIAMKIMVNEALLPRLGNESFMRTYMNYLEQAGGKCGAFSSYYFVIGLGEEKFVDNLNFLHGICKEKVNIFAIRSNNFWKRLREDNVISVCVDFVIRACEGLGTQGYATEGDYYELLLSGMLSIISDSGVLSHLRLVDSRAKRKCTLRLFDALCKQPRTWWIVRNNFLKENKSSIEFEEDSIEFEEDSIEFEEDSI